MNGDPAARLLERFRAEARQVLLDPEQGEPITYGEAWSIAGELVLRWRREGLAPGAVVVIELANGPAFSLCALACLIGGQVMVPVNPELPASDRAVLHRLAAPALVVSEPPELVPYSTDPSIWRTDIDPLRVCAVFFTSGTTGQPKGVCHNLASLVGNVEAFNRQAGFDSSLRMYHVMPMAYMAGFLNTLLSPILAGGRVILGPRFSPMMALDFWRRPEKTGANALWLTPSMAAALVRLNRDPIRARSAAAAFQRIFCGTAPLHPTVRRQFLDTFGVPLQESYGTSELMLVSAQSLVEATAGIESVGAPLAGIEVSVRSDGDGLDELWIRSPFRMLGYLGDDTPSMPGDDGAMATGDAGELRNGILHITGRLKDLIIRGGVNIAPRAVESALGGVAGVDDIAVIGVPHEFWGEAIVVCVEAAAGADPARIEADLLARSRLRLAQSHQPDRIVVRDRFPRAVTGKVQKHLLRQELEV